MSKSVLRRGLGMVALITAGEAVFGLPFVLARVFRPTVLDVFGLTNLQLGVAFSLYGIVAMIAYFAGGPLADRFAPRRLMSVALLGASRAGDPQSALRFVPSGRIGPGATGRLGRENRIP